MMVATYLIANTRFQQKPGVCAAENGGNLERLLVKFHHLKTINATTIGGELFKASRACDGRILPASSHTAASPDLQ